MGKKAKHKAKLAVAAPLDGELEAEATYYARKVGITIHEAATIIREACSSKMPVGRKKQVRRV